MIILGVDPGLARLGFGVIRTEGTRMEMIEYGCIETTPDMTLPRRLTRLYDAMTMLIEHHKPDAVAMEELFFGHNVTTAINVGQARGAALIAAAKHTDELYEYTPMQVKQAVTGTGAADKQQVQRMVKALLKLNEIPKPDDAADGLAVAICHAFMGRARKLTQIR